MYGSCVLVAYIHLYVHMYAYTHIPYYVTVLTHLNTNFDTFENTDSASYISTPLTSLAAVL